MASNSLKATLPSLQNMRVSRELILITEKWRWIFFFCALHRKIAATCLYAPLLQLYHFKSHGYGPDTSE